MTLYDSPPGAPSADCEVCGIATYLRLPIGDGCIALCCDGCERAWPVARAMRANNERLRGRVAELEAGIRRLIAANDPGGTLDRPRPDIAWRDLKRLVAGPATGADPAVKP